MNRSGNLGSGSVGSGSVGSGSVGSGSVGSGSVGSGSVGSGSVGSGDLGSGSVRPRTAEFGTAISGPDHGGRSVPRVLFVPAVIGVLFLLLPLIALFARANWPQLPAAISSPAAVQALELSLRCGGIATVICLLLGVPLAVVMARFQGRWVLILRALTTLPLVLPPLVGGIALLYLLGKHGLVGAQVRTVFGQVPFTTTAVVIAEAFVSMPFLVLSLEGALRTTGTRYEVVGATLGAGRWTVFRRITLPLVGPGLVSATVLCFARALGEFGATALFAGNTQGSTQTMPLAIYEAFNGAGVDQDSAIAMSLLLVLVSAVILVLIRPWRSVTLR